MSRVRASLVNKIESRPYDILVIGAGLSGLMVAYSAAQTASNLRILLIEAGPETARGYAYDRQKDHFGFRQWTGLEPDPFLHNDGASRGGWLGAPRRVLGGRGLYWHGVLCRIDPFEFRDDPGALRWLDRMGLGPDGRSYNALSKVLSSFDCITDSNVPLFANEANLSFCTAVRAFDKRSKLPFNALDLFDLRRSAFGNISIAVKTMATQLARADGYWDVSLTQGLESFSVRAKSVVLAAGVIQNCLLAETALRTNANYQFTDHLDVGLACFIPANSHAFTVFSECCHERYIWCQSKVKGFNLFVTFLERKGGLVAVCWATGEKDINEPIVIDPGQRLSIKARKSQSDLEKEARMKIATQRALEEILEKAGDGGRLRIVAEAGETKLVIKAMAFDDVPAWSCISYTSSLGSTDHEACLSSTSLGCPSDEGAIDDGLFLAGPCALRRMGSANPNFSALAMALSLGYNLSCV